MIINWHAAYTRRKKRRMKGISDGIGGQQGGRVTCAESGQTKNCSGEAIASLKCIRS
jgi:hypothetical protein